MIASFRQRWTNRLTQWMSVFLSWVRVFKTCWVSSISRNPESSPSLRGNKATSQWARLAEGFAYLIQLVSPIIFFFDSRDLRAKSSLVLRRTGSSRLPLDVTKFCGLSLS